MLQESSGNYLNPVHHHLEECQLLLIIRSNLCEILFRRLRPASACVRSLLLDKEPLGFFRSGHCVFVQTGFISDNIVCSSLLRLHNVVHIKTLGSRRAVFVLLLFLILFCHFLLTNMVCIISELRNKMLEFSSNPKAVANYLLDQRLNSLCAM